MRIAALVKQIPAFVDMAIGADGRLRRDGIELEMNPYCRRAVAKAVDLAAGIPGGTCTFITLGPPAAEDVIREALAWAIDHGVHGEGVLVSDRAFAGSDTLATARALAAALTRFGPFDLVLVGLNSVDSDTGQVGPELAELAGLPFLSGARTLDIEDRTVYARCEYDDGWAQATVELPALVSAAERLIEPCKMGPQQRNAVKAEFIHSVSAADLGSGPWGMAASPTTVGAIRVHEVSRDRLRLTGPLDHQVAEAVRLLRERHALARESERARLTQTVPTASHTDGPAIGVIVEPDRANATRELLGTASTLAAAIEGHVVALTFGSDAMPVRLARQGADLVSVVSGASVAEDAAGVAIRWVTATTPWAVLAPSTAWGREVMSRLAARLGAGLIGDAISLEVDDGHRLVAWKPAFGGQLVAAIQSASTTQMATVRIGMLPTFAERAEHMPPIDGYTVEARSRVRLLSSGRDDELDRLADARAVVGVGIGVESSDYWALQPLLQVLDAELGATRKVTDRGWLPRARQIGITGRSIAPRLYVAIGVSGRFNHTVGLHGAETILAINSDPNAPIFNGADIGVVADWREIVPLLVAELRSGTDHE